MKVLKSSGEDKAVLISFGVTVHECLKAYTALGAESIFIDYLRHKSPSYWSFLFETYWCLRHQAKHRIMWRQCLSCLRALRSRSSIRSSMRISPNINKKNKTSLCYKGTRFSKTKRAARNARTRLNSNHLANQTTSSLSNC